MVLSYIQKAVVLKRKLSTIKEELEVLGYKELFPSNGDYTMVHHSYFMSVNNVKGNAINCGTDYDKFIELIKQGVKKENGIL